MTLGHGFWIIVWYGILLLGLAGLWASVAWGRRLQWENLDELLRAVGTIQVSVGMLLLLYGKWPQVATGLLGLALGVFIAAFVAVRHLPPADDGDDENEEADTHPALRDLPGRSDPPFGPEQTSSKLNREAFHE